MVPLFPMTGMELTMLLSLKQQADIGVGMGITGTEWFKGASGYGTCR